MSYGEFCFELLDDDKEKGRYRVKTNWTQEEKDEVEKEHDYYSVVLCISIVCLSVTIIIYVVFREGLLKLMYNKIMINFAGSLLLAFLSLVVMQNLEVEEQTRSTCIGLALLNQFAFLSAFSLMTLMSYNIFAQLHNMRVGSGTSSGLLKVALCYIIPGLITLVTLIVELTAPRCAAVRPKFGTKYNYNLCRLTISWKNIFFQELPLLRRSGQVCLALPSDPCSPPHQHRHVHLHCDQHLQDQVK